LGGNCEKTNLEITELILELMNEGEDKINYVADRLGHDLRYAIDFAKAKRDLGWEPEIDFSEGLKMTIEWYRNNEDWWKKLKK
jgi:dTDP-glucose 4,6-dehydratase